MGTVDGISTECNARGGQTDELRRDIGVELVDALLRQMTSPGRQSFHDVLRHRIGAPPEDCRRKLFDRRNPDAGSWESLRTRRAQRLYITQLALRSVLTYDELDRLARIASAAPIHGKDANKVARAIGLPDRLDCWGLSRPALAIEGQALASGHHGPTAGSIVAAARALSACATAALAGEPEKLSENDKRAMHTVLRFLELDRRRQLRKPTAAAEKKRRQRARAERERDCAAEREELDRAVAEGKLEHPYDEVYASLSPGAAAG